MAAAWWYVADRAIRKEVPRVRQRSVIPWPRRNRRVASEPSTRMLSIVWVTNVPAPYRRPLWKSLADASDLVIFLLESDRHIQQQGRRGSDWLAASVDDLDVRLLRALAVSGGENARFLIMQRLHSIVSADVVLVGGWDSPAYWQLLLAAKLTGTRCVGFYESTLLSQRHQRGLVSKIRAHFFRQLDAVVTPGVAATTAVLAMGVPRSRVYEGFNSIDSSLFNRTAPPVADDHAEGHRFLYVGQFIPRKNIPSLIRAFASIPPEGHSLDLVGSGEDFQHLHELADRYSISNIRFSSALPSRQVAELMRSHHTLVLPSWEEVWGLVVNEALACGMHVVVSERAGVAASVSGMQGVFIVGTSSESIASGMRASIAAWNGPIQSPEILKYTPDSFADVFRAAFNGAHSSASV